MQHLQQKPLFLSILYIDPDRPFCYDIYTTQGSGKEENNMNWAAIFWLVLLVMFILAEASTVAVVSLWFAAGALAAILASMLGAQLWLQVVLFVTVSVVLLLLLRPITKKFFIPKLSRTNIDAVIGTQGIVTETIENVTAQGRIKLGAMEWSARSSSGEKIEAGALVKVDKIEGVKVFVTPVPVKNDQEVTV